MVKHKLITAQTHHGDNRDPIKYSNKNNESQAEKQLRTMREQTTVQIQGKNETEQWQRNEKEKSNAKGRQ